MKKIIFIISAFLFIGTALFITAVTAFGSVSAIKINSLHMISFFPSAIIGLISCSICFFINIGINKLLKIKKENTLAFFVLLLAIELILFSITLYKLFYYIGRV